MPVFSEIKPSDPQLEPIIGKLACGIRLDKSDGLALERTTDFHSVCQMANKVKRRMHGTKAGYIVNVHINYTNICIWGCSFCAYGRKPGTKDGYILSPEKAAAEVDGEIDEIHITGGINPDLRANYFIDLVETLHSKYPRATIKAFTAIELNALAQREGRSVKIILKQLQKAGLGMIPGGGAEIFNEKVRNKICAGKASAEEWLNVHETAHKMGIPSNSTMLHGHIETDINRIDHLVMLRTLQDQTGGFVAHIPLPYLHGSNKLSAIGSAPSGMLDLKQVAIARLMLDNVPHIKAYWRAMGIKVAQTALLCGADDLDGTVRAERIMHEAGSDAPRGLTSSRIERIIRDAGLEPYRRNALHCPVEEVTA